MLESDGLDPTTENCLFFFQPIKCRVQLSDDCLRLVCDDDQFEIELFVYHLNTSSALIFLPDAINCNY